MKRILLSMFIAVSALFAGLSGATSTAHAWNLYYVSNPPCAHFCFGVEAWYEADQASNQVVDQTPYFGKYCYNKIPQGLGYTIRSCTPSTAAGQDAGGNHYIIYAAVYSIQINRPGYLANFNCDARVIAYSFGGSYSYWGSDSPDTRCADFSNNQNGFENGDCGPSTGDTSLSGNYNLTYNGSYVGYFYVSYRIGSVPFPTLPCVNTEFQAVSFYAAATTWAQDQISGEFWEGVSGLVLVNYIEGGTIPGYGGGTAYTQLTGCTTGSSPSCTDTFSRYYIRWRTCSTCTIHISYIDLHGHWNGNIDPPQVHQ
jgi:hypothetical protein